MRSRVNIELEKYLQRDADCPKVLREAMSYSLLGGGKRLRPVLVLLACESCGGELEAALPAACAVEMVHTYSLIHDDLPAMDDDELRRGRPTNHVQFGEATAILAGDALLTLAFEVMARDLQPFDVAARCCTELACAAGAAGMVGGQMADLKWESAGTATLEELESIHRRKTGCLFACSLRMGGLVARAGTETLASLDVYGKSVGLAFQIADDLLDIQGDRERMGKAVRKDAARGKLTYPALLGEQASREKASRLIEQASRSIRPLGEGGRRLDALAHFILQRDH